MKKLFLFSLALLTACSTNNAGNYAGANEDQNGLMATDTATQLATIFPPASTKLKLNQSTEDAFGKSLISQLHGHGYAIVEKHSALTSTEVDSQANQEGVDFAYTVGELKNDRTKDYFLIIKVGDKKISRVYELSGNTVTPLSAWTHKE